MCSVIGESMQVVEAQESFFEPRKIPKTICSVVARKGFEVEEKILRIGAVLKEGQVAFQVAIAEIVGAGAAESEKAGNGLWRLDCLVDIG